MVNDNYFGYAFPALRGIQAGREYFVSMCPLRLIPKIFFYDEDEAELSPEQRAQRTLNKGRVPEMAEYIVENRDDYVFSAITASIDADVEFQPVGETGTARDVGQLRVPMDARFIINDGQHRRAAIEKALQEEPALGEESIAVVFFLDKGLDRCQQMFADLNRHAVRPSKSLGVLYDHRDDMAAVVRLAVFKSDFFDGLVEMERSSLSRRSRKLFTLSSLYSATSELLEDFDFDSADHAAETTRQYWEAVANSMPQWRLVKDREMTAGEVRDDFIHSFGTVLQALGRLGNHLLQHHSDDWRKYVASLEGLDWSRSNTQMWEGRAMEGGRISRSNRNIRLTTSAIKQFLDLDLTEEEKKEEHLFRETSNASQ